MVLCRDAAVEIPIESGPLFPVMGYPSLIYLLFYHLFDNAIKFRSTERNIEIHIDYTRVNGLYINHADVSPESFYEPVTVKDNGIGFEPEFTGKIFHMFYKINHENKFKGSGMGLAFCRKIMQLHDGFILAESIPGKGSIFYSNRRRFYKISQTVNNKIFLYIFRVPGLFKLLYEVQMICPVACLTFKYTRVRFS